MQKRYQRSNYGYMFRLIVIKLMNKLYEDAPLNQDCIFLIVEYTKDHHLLHRQFQQQSLPVLQLVHSMKQRLQVLAALQFI